MSKPYTGKTHGGKGSRPRPRDQKAFSENYDKLKHDDKPDDQRPFKINYR